MREFSQSAKPGAALARMGRAALAATAAYSAVLMAGCPSATTDTGDSSADVTPGPTGPAGDTGAAGEDGADGSQGSVGNGGDTGDAGVTGPQGDSGDFPPGTVIFTTSPNSPSGFAYTGQSFIAGQNWTNFADPVSARAGLALVGYNRKLYAMGGVAGQSNVSADVENYDPDTDSWSFQTSMPQAVAFHAAVELNNRIYVTGGRATRYLEAPDSSSSALRIFDPAQNRWLDGADMPTPRSGHASVALNGLVYVIGGAPAMTQVDAYDPAGNTWQGRASLPAGRSNFAAVVVNGKILAIGGSGAADQVHEYDPAANTWTARAHLLTPREGLVAGVLNGRVCAIGGLAFTNSVGAPVRSIELYDPNFNTWSAGLGMPTPRTEAAATSLGGRIYVLGGGDGDVHETASLEGYDPGQWLYGHQKISQ